MKSIAKHTLSLAVAAVLLSGCASVGRKLDQTSVDKIQKGITTREQVLQLIGSPEQISKNSAGEVTFQYLYTRASAKAATFIPIVGVFAGGANVQTQSVSISFGADGVVKDVVSSYGATETGMGMSTGSKAALDPVEQDKRPK